MQKNGAPHTDVPVTVLLKAECRNEESAAAVARIATDMGLELSMGGVASLCFRATQEQVAAVFKVQPCPTPKRRGGESDFGAAAGYASQELPVPESLEPYVASISIMGPPTRMR